jgi:hypothetical protein
MQMFSLSGPTMARAMATTMTAASLCLSDLARIENCSGGDGRPNHCCIFADNFARLSTVESYLCGD